MIWGKTISIKIFIAPIAIFLVCVPYLANRNIPLTFIILASLAFVIILASIGLLYVGLKIDRYVQENDFQLWKRSKSHSLKERIEAGKAIKTMSMHVPQLEECVKKVDKIAFVLLAIWTTIFLLILSFIIFTGV
jgi:hypothetical protein